MSKVFLLLNGILTLIACGNPLHVSWEAHLVREHGSVHKADQARLARQRGLDFKNDVTSRHFSRAQAMKYIKNNFESHRQVFERDQRLLRVIGVLGPHDDYVSLLSQVLEKKVAGFYDPKAKIIGVLPENNDVDRVIALMVRDHELTHALQDQHFPHLMEALVDPERSFDERLAVQCLLEGEATVLGLESFLYRLVLDVQAWSDLVIESEDLLTQWMSASESTPILNQLRKRPYIDGAHFVDSLRQRYGWDHVNQVLKQATLCRTHDVLSPSFFSGLASVRPEAPPSTHDFDRPGALLLSLMIDHDVPAWQDDLLVYSEEKNQAWWMIQFQTEQVARCCQNSLEAWFAEEAQRRDVTIVRQQQRLVLCLGNSAESIPPWLWEHGHDLPGQGWDTWSCPWLVSYQARPQGFQISFLGGWLLEIDEEENFLHHSFLAGCFRDELEAERSYSHLLWGLLASRVQNPRVGLDHRTWLAGLISCTEAYDLRLWSFLWFFKMES